MPACPVKHHHGMVLLGKRFGEAIKKHLHRCRIGIRQHKCEGMISARLNGSEDVGKGEAFIAQARRALAPLPPDVADAALLADARLVLEEQAKALVFMRMLNFFEKHRSSF
jgi:hypothetical protein